MKIFQRTLILCLSLFTAAQVFAGMKIDTPLVANANFIAGNFGATRNSNDTISRLYTYNYGYQVGVIAINSQSQFYSCVTTDEEMMRTIRNIRSDSYLQVYIWDDGQCRTINVWDSSAFAPKL